MNNVSSTAGSPSITRTIVPTPPAPGSVLVRVAGMNANGLLINGLIIHGIILHG